MEYVSYLSDADVAPVVHGRWIEDERTYPGAGLSNNLCSVCGGVGGTWKKGLEPERKWHFCPNCGAKMEGGGNAKGGHDQGAVYDASK